MKASRGRLGQYKILYSEERLRKHLVEKELFSKTSFFKFIEKYQMIVIKPAFGSGEIIVSVTNNAFQVTAYGNSTTMTSREDVYHYLVSNETKQKYYILQPGKLPSRFLQSPFQYFVTVHRKTASSNWYCAGKTGKYSAIFGKFFYFCFLRKIESLATLAAETLGKVFPDCNTMVIDMLYDLKGGIWIQDTILHLATSKWNQYHALSALPSFVPDTDLVTKASFSDFLHKYEKVVIKPCIGQQGLGIAQISLNSDLSYSIHSGRKKLTQPNIEEAYRFIEKQYLSKKYYLVQQKLSLATINDCPIDVRVITQKVDSIWKSTGKIVKVAGSDFFVTNAVQKLLPLETAIEQSAISHINIQMLESTIDEVCLSAAKQLEENHPDITIIGFDIGVTDQGNVLIIEGNFVPDLTMFAKLEDKSIHTNIINLLKNERK